MDPRVLALQFQIGSFVLDRNLAGVDHAQSLVAPRPGGNTMNWIVGHVVRTRNRQLGFSAGHRSSKMPSSRSTGPVGLIPIAPCDWKSSGDASTR